MQATRHFYRVALVF